MEMRRRVSSKSEVCLEGRGVDAARMSGEVCVHYPGRPRPLPPWLPLSRGGGKADEESAEGIVPEG